jgi:toxin HigB-1
VIKNFKHKGLDALFNNESKKGVPARHLKRIVRILTRLNASIRPQDMNLPGLDLHELAGKQKGVWAVTVSGNWRITFLFAGSDAVDVNYIDYHKK